MTVLTRLTDVVVTVSVDPTVLVLVTKLGVLVTVDVLVACTILSRELQNGVATASDCIMVTIELRLLQLAASRSTKAPGLAMTSAVKSEAKMTIILRMFDTKKSTQTYHSQAYDCFVRIQITKLDSMERQGQDFVDIDYGQRGCSQPTWRTDAAEIIDIMR